MTVQRIELRGHAADISFGARNEATGQRGWYQGFADAGGLGGDDVRRAGPMLLRHALGRAHPSCEAEAQQRDKKGASWDVNRHETFSTDVERPVCERLKYYTTGK